MKKRANTKNAMIRRLRREVAQLKRYIKSLERQVYCWANGHPL